jgi:hypothetical protein
MDAGGSARCQSHHRIPSWILVAGVTMLMVGCGSPARTVGPGDARTGASSSTASPRPVPPPARCQAWDCHAGQTITLIHGWTVRLWLGADPTNYRSRPVVELLRERVAVQWWISPRGDGWNGSLACLTSAAEPNCDLIDSLGMHADVAEMLILRGGRLLHQVGAEAITNSVGMRAADLDGDGYLDVVGTSNDYRPNFAQGHDYWETFRYHGGRLTVTGCARKSRTGQPPTRLLTGACPTI